MVNLPEVSRFLNRWIEYLLFGLGFSMAVIVAVQVFFRYVLNQSLFWSEELARYMLVWLTFLGASVAYYRRVHPGVDMIVTRLSAGGQRAMALAVHLISIAFFAVMVVYGTQFSYFVRLQITPALYLPKWIVFAIIPVSGAVLLVHGLSFFMEELSKRGAS